MSFTRKVAGIEREFKLDVRAAIDIETRLDKGLVSVGRLLNSGDIKFVDIATILFCSRVNKDPVEFEIFCQAIQKEGYTIYIDLIGDLLLDFFHPAARE